MREKYFSNVQNLLDMKVVKGTIIQSIKVRSSKMKKKKKKIKNYTVVTKILINFSTKYFG